MRIGICMSLAVLLLAGCSCSGERLDVETKMQVVEDDSLKSFSAAFSNQVSDRVFFDFDQSSLSPEARAVLDKQADWLKLNANRKVLLEGHCDERGTREYNLGLGARRANAVAGYLKSRGVPSERIRTISYGKDRPIVTDGSKEEFHRVNRVTISVLEA